MERSHTPRMSTLVYCTFEQQVLMLNRQTTPYQGYLIPPGGKCEFGEIPINCARREFAEETGYIITEVLQPRGLVYDYSKAPEWNWLIFIYSFEIKEKPKLVEEKHPLTWIDLTAANSENIPQADLYLMDKLFTHHCSYIELAMEYSQPEQYTGCTSQFTIKASNNL